jgi:hypothetical protein
MVAHVTFGRRGAPPPLRQGARWAAAAAPSPAGARNPERPVPPALFEQAPEPHPVDYELAAWKHERARHHRMPWRQISLMAGLCFGIAAFKLPSAVNDVVQWPLYALMAISFYSGLRRRRQK